jgi:hypothetical protein
VGVSATRSCNAVARYSFVTPAIAAIPARTRAGSPAHPATTRASTESAFAAGPPQCASELAPSFLETPGFLREFESSSDPIGVIDTRM